MRDGFRYDECFEALRTDSYIQTPSTSTKDRLWNLIGQIWSQDNETSKLHATLEGHAYRPNQQSSDKCRSRDLPTNHQLRSNGEHANAAVHTQSASDLETHHDGVPVDAKPSNESSASDYSRNAQNASNAGESSTAIDVWVYTKLVKEYADQQNILPNYSPEEICSFPPWFANTASLMGLHGKGEGRDKKTARHQASMNLWLQLQATMNSKSGRW